VARKKKINRNKDKRKKPAERVMTMVEVEGCLDLTSSSTQITTDCDP
jgi:hypothetical protein